MLKKNFDLLSFFLFFDKHDTLRHSWQRSFVSSEQDHVQACSSDCVPAAGKTLHTYRQRLSTCFLSQVLTAIYPAQTMALAAGVIPVANMPAAALAAPAQDTVGSSSSPNATGTQNSVPAVPLPNTELQSKVEVKREVQPEGPDEDDGYGYSSSMASSSLATAGNSSVFYASLLTRSYFFFSRQAGCVD